MNLYQSSKIYRGLGACFIKLDKDEKGKSINSTMYRGMIGYLLYLTASRPDIMYSVCLCARFQSCPKESHLSVVKRILRYLKGTMDIGLWYPKSDKFELIRFSNVDYAGCRVERKNTSGTCHFLGHSLVSWHSKKQNSVALSTAEAKYIAVGLCCAQILWIKQTLSDFNLSFEHVPIKCDNTSAINISKNLVQHFRTKHIEIRHHFLRDHAQKGDITLEFAVDRIRTDRPVRRGCRFKYPPALHFLTRFLYARHNRFQLFFRAPRVSGVCFSLFTSLVSFIFAFLMALRRDTVAFRARASARFDTTIFSTVEDYQMVYESKAWPTVSGFEPREVIQRMCGLADAQGMGKPSAHSLTVINEVSYFKAFLVDSILRGRRIHVGYLMMMHMILCYESTTRVLPYGHFLTRVFKDVGVDLSRETYFKAPDL
ncbi:hypothetical protein AAG906_010302 [Vitis piasezkii]